MRRDESPRGGGVKRGKASLGAAKVGVGAKVGRRGQATSRGRASSLPSRAALYAELLRRVEADCETLARAQADAMEAATHDEAKPESDKDTRALEASYLARGQAERLVQAREALAELRMLSPKPWPAGEPAGVGALVSYVLEESQERTVWLLPQAGGEKLAAGRVQVVTPASPLGRAIQGKRAGEVGELQLGGERRELAVARVW